jgi:Ca2+-binding RTX toxin-like protein
LISGITAGISDSSNDGGTITNFGVIQSSGDGVYVFTNTGRTTTITNEAGGIITGTAHAIFTQTFGAISLNNQGTINGDIDCTVTGASNFVSNQGVINGNVIFAQGNGTFIDAGLGHVTGMIEGGAGTDTFVAGRAKETFLAGSGVDTFVFNSVHFSPATAKHDTVLNFSSLVGDKIDVHNIDANVLLAGHQHFVFIGTQTFAHFHSHHPGVIGMLRFVPGPEQLQGTVDGDFAHPDFVVALPGVATLHASDLILV